MSVPYQFATSRNKAREEIQRILQRFGCDSVGFMERFTDKTLLLAFTYRGRAVQLQASASGWAALYLKENPWTPRRKNAGEVGAGRPRSRHDCRELDPSGLGERAGHGDRVRGSDVRFGFSTLLPDGSGRYAT